MWTPPDYDIIVETLTGSEFEVTVRETDTIGYLKYRIKKYEGIPVNQQHILFQQKELKDATVLKDVPLVRGSRLTLVLGMRGGPISARRVVTDCDNWYDLSDVLNSANRGQLTPIEPLTISTTTGVKVLLYKDCKKNINRLMKLRKHHLHSHGTGTNGSGTSSSMTGNSIKCASAGSASGPSTSASSSSRTQLKFLDKHHHIGSSGPTMDDNCAVDAQDQQWLLDNIATLKKMKQLRQTMEAKKKKKHRPSDPPADTLTQNLKELELELQMNEKLQKWLHRVASNTTHLSDATDLPTTITANKNCSSLATGAATVSCSSASSSPLNLFDRVRRKPTAMAGLAAAATGLSSSGQQEAVMSFARGGARKKESYPGLTATASSASMDRFVAYSMAMENFYVDYKPTGGEKKGISGGGGLKQELSASGVYEVPKLLIREDSPIETGGASATAITATKTSTAAEERFSSLGGQVAAAEEDGLGGLAAESERLKKRRESSQFEERLLTQFYDNSSPQCENFFRAFATTSDGASSSASSSFHKESSSSSSAAAALNNCGGGERVSKFKWRFHGDGVDLTSGSGGGGGGSVATGGTSPGASEADIFLNSLLLKRNKSSKIQKFTKLNFDHTGGSVATAAKRWTDEEVEQVIRGGSGGGGGASGETLAATENVIEEGKQKPSEKVAKATVIDLVGQQKETGEPELEVEEASPLLGAACPAILDEEEYRQFLDEDVEHLARIRENYKLLDMMTFDSSESDSCGEISILKGEGFYDLYDGATERREGVVNRQRGDFPAADEEQTEGEEDEEEDEEDDDEGEVEVDVEEDDDGYDDEDENSDEDGGDDALEFDDFAYFPSTSFRSSFRKQSSTLRPVLDDDEEEDGDGDEVEIELDPAELCPNHRHHGSASGSSFLPRIDQHQHHHHHHLHHLERTSSPLELRATAAGDLEDEESDFSTEVLRRPPRIGPGERLIGPSLPEIISQGAAAEERRRERIKFENAMFGEPTTAAAAASIVRPAMDDPTGGASNGGLKRERSGPADGQGGGKLPDIKLLESDLKMMGLDVILNDSDESFERTIKRHFRADQAKAAAPSRAANVSGEVLLRTGNEEQQKKLKQELGMDLIEWVELPDPRRLEQEQAKKGNRCAKCNKKLGLIMIMKCHCGLLFCAQHRYAEAHDCTYDFKEEGKRILAKENPLVVGEKLPKI